MLVPGISETVAPATVGGAHPFDQTADSGSHTFADALASAGGAARHSSLGNPSASDSAASKAASQPAKADTQPKIADSAVATGRWAGVTARRGIASRPAGISSSSDSASSSKAKSATASTTAGGATAAAATPPIPPASVPVPVPIAPAPDPISATATLAATSLDGDAIGPETGTKAVAVPVPDSSAAKVPDNGRDVTAVPDTVAANAATEGPIDASNSAGTQNQPQQTLAPDGTPATDTAQVPMNFLAAPAQPSDASNPKIVANSPAQTNHGSAVQPGAAVENATQGTSPAPTLQIQPVPTDAASTTTSAVAEQKHDFVAATLHAVSSSIATAIQAPFTAATSELSKSAPPVAPPPPIATSAATSQASSGSRSGAGSNGQSSSGHSDTQSGSSPSQDTFPNHAGGDAPPSIQSANDPSATAAVRSDVAAGQSNQVNAPISATPDGKAPASSDLAGSLQTAAASSAGAISNAAALPGAQVSQAHLFGGAGATQMRISLNTDALGPIELQATSDKDRIGAVIAAVKPETQELLISELPALHQALSERNLQIQQLTVNQGALAGGMAGRGGYSQSSDAWQKQAGANYWQSPTKASPSTDDLPGAVMSVVAMPGKLSVHA
jgi:Flagellar hook-length control protein FliK